MPALEPGLFGSLVSADP